jgi:hypothetical protein
MKVLNTISGSFEELPIDRVSKNIYLGLLYTLLDKVYELKRKRELVYQETYEHLYKTRRHVVRRTYRDTPIKTLIKFSGKRLYGVNREEDNLVLHVRTKYRVDARRDNLERIVKKLIASFKHGFIEYPRVTYLTNGYLVHHKIYGYGFLYSFSDVQEEKRAPKKKSKPIVQAPIVKEDKPKQKVREVFVKDVIEEDDVYRGSLFPVPAFQQLKILLN